MSIEQEKKFHVLVQIYYLVGCDRIRARYYILKIDRTRPMDLQLQDDQFEYRVHRLQHAHYLASVSDSSRYTLSEVLSVLHTIAEGSRPFGGLKKVCVAYGIFGTSFGFIYIFWKNYSSFGTDRIRRIREVPAGILHAAHHQPKEGRQHRLPLDLPRWWYGTLVREWMKTS